MSNETVTTFIPTPENLREFRIPQDETRFVVQLENGVTFLPGIPSDGIRNIWETAEPAVFTLDQIELYSPQSHNISGEIVIPKCTAVLWHGINVNTIQYLSSAEGEHKIATKDFLSYYGKYAIQNGLSPIDIVIACNRDGYESRRKNGFQRWLEALKHGDLVHQIQIGENFQGVAQIGYGSRGKFTVISKDNKVSGKLAVDWPNGGIFGLQELLERKKLEKSV